MREVTHLPCSAAGCRCVPGSATRVVAGGGGWLDKGSPSVFPAFPIFDRPADKIAATQFNPGSRGLNCRHAVLPWLLISWGQAPVPRAVSLTPFTPPFFLCLEARAKPRLQ